MDERSKERMPHNRKLLFNLFIRVVAARAPFANRTKKKKKQQISCLLCPEPIINPHTAHTHTHTRGTRAILQCFTLNTKNVKTVFGTYLTSSRAAERIVLTQKIYCCCCKMAFSVLCVCCMVKLINKIDEISSLIFIYIFLPSFRSIQLFFSASLRRIVQDL